MSISRGPVRRNAPFERKTQQIAPLDAGPREQQARHPLSRDSWSHTHIYCVTKPRCIGCRVCNDFRYNTLLSATNSSLSAFFAALSQASTDRHGSPRKPITVRACAASVSKRLVPVHTSAVLPRCIGCRVSNEFCCAAVQPQSLRILAACAELRASIDHRPPWIRQRMERHMH